MSKGQLLTPFLIALQFLTVLPVRLKQIPDQKMSGISMLYYPLVGGIIGLLLAIPVRYFDQASASVMAALLVAWWAWLTGTLHLDGLADSADAWIGGLGDKEKTLTIMKDPRCGPAAVVALMVVLLIKFVTLTELISTAHWAILIIPPTLGRTAVILLFLTTPYVRSGGLGSEIASHLPRRTGIAVIVLIWAITFCIFGMDTFGLLFILIGIFLGFRSLWLTRIGGTTGDTAGALVEIMEVAVLLIMTLA